MLLIIHFLIVAVNIVLGLVFRKGKGTFLIAGYNTASRAAKERIDEKKLCLYMSRLMFVLAGCWLIIAACEIFGKIWLLWLGLVLFLLSAIIGVIYINTGGRILKCKTERRGGELWKEISCKSSLQDCQKNPRPTTSSRKSR